MTHGEFQTFVIKIHDFYGDRFPGLVPGMAKYWFESLRYTEEDIADMALHRWVRQHTLKAPSLDELLEQIEYVQEEERQARRNWDGAKNYTDLLKLAAEMQAQNPERSEDDVTYGRLMALLAERSLNPWFDSQSQQHPKLTQEQRGEQCLLWARKYGATRPQLAEDLQAAARQYGIPMYIGTALAANEQEIIDDVG